LSAENSGEALSNFLKNKLRPATAGRMERRQIRMSSAQGPTLTAVKALSANVLKARFEDFDAKIVENAKLRLIDVIGCAIGGANAAGNRALVDIVRNWGGKAEATVFVHGGKVPMGNAAMVNAILCRSFDFEAMSIIVEGQWIPSHHSGTTVMTALSVGEAYGISGKEMVTALVAGDDVVARVLAASGWDFSLGWDGTMTLPVFGATPIAGRIMGLTAHQLRHAFGIALNTVAGAVQSLWDCAATFKLGQGTSARNGIFSAELAKAGWTGVDDALTSKMGYYYLYGKGKPDKPEILTQYLGKKYYMEETFKAYPCGLPNAGSITCARAIAANHKLAVEDIEEVYICVSAPALGIYYAAPYHLGEFPHADGIFRYQFTVATALLRGDVRPEHFTEDAIRNPELQALIAKSKCVELVGAKGWGSCEVRVKLKNGVVLSEAAETYKGDPMICPLTRDEIIAKYWIQVEFSRTVSKENAAKALDLIDNIEKLDNVSALTELLVG
jgi:2-methylcitrate dehydratase PrpD